MKRFDSGTLIPGSTWRAEADTVAEVVRRAVENMRNFNGETDVRPEPPGIEFQQRRVGDRTLAIIVHEVFIDDIAAARCRQYRRRCRDRDCKVAGEQVSQAGGLTRNRRT